ncbi:hypothetical protein CV093_13510 [Oceanobacillus sp. 143]|nr:hypothetical protein CV093_13510 [Oceanobacillus sp. 143]
MWKQWKNKFKSIFGEEEEEEHTERETSHDNAAQNVKARVTYQYPKKSSFRFPVIPDERVGKKQTDNTPAYRKKDTPNHLRKETPNYQRKREEKVIKEIKVLKNK